MDDAIAFEMMEQDFRNVREFAKNGLITKDEIMRWLSREFEGKRWVHADRMHEVKKANRSTDFIRKRLAAKIKRNHQEGRDD